jgi:hypothetical protein
MKVSEIWRQTHDVDEVFKRRIGCFLLQADHPFDERYDRQTVYVQRFLLYNRVSDGGHDVRPASALGVHYVERLRCRIGECDIQHSGGDVFGTHPRDYLIAKNGLYIRVSLVQEEITLRTPREFGSEPRVTPDLTMIGTQSVVAHDPFGPPEI